MASHLQLWSDANRPGRAPDHRTDAQGALTSIPFENFDPHQGSSPASYIARTRIPNDLRPSREASMVPMTAYARYRFAATRRP